MVTKARAADVLGRIRVVELAVHGYLGENNAWPAESGTGAIPTGLLPFLPENFSFSAEDYQMDWENGGGLIGVAIVTDNTGASIASVKPMRERLLKEMGLQLVVDETFTPPLADATPLIQKVRTAKPDILFALPKIGRAHV